MKWVLQMAKHGGKYGRGVELVTSVCDEEYERELEREVEKEEEIIVQLRCEKPAEETIWSYAQAVHATGPADLNVTTLTLSELIHRIDVLKEFENFPWPAKVKFTSNFANTIRASTDLTGFVRSVDAALVFPDGTWLLLSNREADILLPHFWARKSPTAWESHVCFVNFPLVRSSLNAGVAPRMVLPEIEPSRPVSPLTVQERTVRTSVSSLVGGVMGLFRPTSQSKDDAVGKSNGKKGGKSRKSGKSKGRDTDGMQKYSADVCDEKIIAMLQLFMGETSYPSEKREDALQSVLSLRAGGERADEGRKVARQFLRERGTAHSYERSDLARMIASME